MKLILRCAFYWPLGVFWLAVCILVYPFIKFVYWLDDEQVEDYSGMALALLRGVSSTKSRPQ